MVSELWAALALDKTDKRITVVAINPDRKRALINAKERMELEGQPILALNLVGNYLKNKLSYWLAEQDILGAENTQAVRDFGKSMMKLLEECKPHDR